MIGEHLAEGDEYNVAIMHAFVDFLDFRNFFLDAVYVFLQAFRLPGEAQMIDHFMLKAPALPTPAPALLDSPRGGAPPVPRKTAVWTAMTPPGAMTPPLA
ncbi:uncharacterized protein F5147DRAFT_780030 [Suillus discolor]|uniref:SEC7 domain-containing protein n=1 Tax=Suillus discolor TaxID=1912936 RepID=A0A9P7EVE4_9AGAM|nr:uncharacterized protein F5147DRAFT_780030 [Suillus discolor]KAG2091346.1 hypothetical protein F5147DRAFT_780030 [Suillus discolor]